MFIVYYLILNLLKFKKKIDLGSKIVPGLTEIVSLSFNNSDPHKR